MPARTKSAALRDARDASLEICEQHIADLQRRLAEANTTPELGRGFMHVEELRVMLR